MLQIYHVFSVDEVLKSDTTIKFTKQGLSRLLKPGTDDSTLAEGHWTILRAIVLHGNSDIV